MRCSRPGCPSAWLRFRAWLAGVISRTRAAVQAARRLAVQLPPLDLSEWRSRLQWRQDALISLRVASSQPLCCASVLAS